MRNEIILVGGFLVVLLAGSSCYNRNYFYIYVANNSFYSNEKTASNLYCLGLLGKLFDRICLFANEKSCDTF